MEPTTQSKEFLILGLAYCLTWELFGAKAPSYWDHLHEYIEEESGLNERERWTLELYEEVAPTVQEERSILGRLVPLLNKPVQLMAARDVILTVLPKESSEAALRHSLLRPLQIPDDQNVLKKWLSGLGAKTSLDSNGYSEMASSLSTREADFNHFLLQPFFVEGFRRFWHKPPKKRSNRQTRALVGISAALSQMICPDDLGQTEYWCHRVAEACHLTKQTEKDVYSLVAEMVAFTYDASELAGRIFADASVVDKQNFSLFMSTHSDLLSEFKDEFERELNFDSNFQTAK